MTPSAISQKTKTLLTIGAATREATRSLLAAPIRTLTVVVIVTIGIAASVGVFAINESGKSDISREFDRRRSVTITLVDTQKELASSRGFPNDLDERMAALGPVVATGVMLVTDTVPISAIRGHNYDSTVDVLGIDVAILTAAEAKVIPLPNWPNGDCARREGLIGHAAAKRLGIGVFPALPSTVDIAGQPIAIVGVIKSAPLFPRLDNSIAVPECVVRQLSVPIISRNVVIKAHPDGAEFVAQHAALVARPSNPDTLNTSFLPSPKGLRRVIEGTTQRIVLLVGFGVAVLAGFIVAVTNASAVSQRRQEIGLRQVFGARRQDIYLQIFMESFIIGLCAGEAGTLLGICGVVLASQQAHWMIVVRWELWLVGPFAGALIGIVGGIAPAYLATRIEPRAALTHR